MNVSPAIPQYTNKDVPIMLGSMLPLTLLMNYFLFGGRYFSEWEVFAAATVVTFIILSAAFIGYGTVAILLRNRLPEENQRTKRFFIIIPIFILMSGVLLSLVFRGYEMVGFLGYEFNENSFIKAYSTLIIMNIFLTFLNEGVSRFEVYKATVTETEQLKKAYMESQLLGLKSQMNPHFLFNSLNTLSCLIHEDEDEAEDFLNEMSKVYRYLLRTNDEPLVPLQTELSFIQSYYNLLRARHGDALQLTTAISPENRELLIPPMTLQFIVENAMNQNTVSKAAPLKIHIATTPDARIEVVNNVQEKMCCEEDERGIENIRDKFRLLCREDIVIEETAKQRVIRMPLIPSKEWQTA